ncbi:hypothetical protein ACH5RR_005182 [Cinchona calisaya]|uniref:Uncharacterized protein n=1 Tax=Cinchona calisaya TaxID=153742 RepID=A0ABD3AKF6_9GENT
MMESELLQPSWPLFNTSNDHSALYSFPMDICTDEPHDFSSSFSTEESSGISFDSYFAAMTSPDSLIEFPTFGDENQVMETIANIMDGLEPISSCGVIDQDYIWIEESEENISSHSQLTSDVDEWSPCPPMEQSKPSTSKNMALIFPVNNMETDKQLCVHHLLRAYSEAMENGHQELTEVIVKRISEKLDPLGEPLERVAFHLFQSAESQADYLREQASKNYEAAFKAFYQCFPYGRFAHFTANSAILEAMPSDVDTIHIVDFDMGDGVQWPPLMEAMSRKGKGLRLTSIKSSDGSHSQWNFEDTNRRLYDHARSLGLSLNVEEMTLEDLVIEIKILKKKEWLAFNLMVALPHMGRRPERSHVQEFLRAAKELLAYSIDKKGIITIGDGEAGPDYFQACPEYASFFNSYFTHYQALFESMDCNFPVYLAEARIAMETVFLAPYVSSHYSCFQQWKEIRDTQALSGLDGLRMSRGSVIEAKEIVNEPQSTYQVKIQAEMENEMVLEWRGIPLEYGHMSPLDDGMEKVENCICKNASQPKYLLRKGMGGIVVAFTKAGLKTDESDLVAVVNNPKSAPVTLDPIIYISA